MAEKFVTQYQRLFEINVLHHYWLDDGTTAFDLIAPLEKKTRRLSEYDRRPFLSIRPTATTSGLLKGFHCVYKDTALGCVVAVPRAMSLPTDAVLEFLIKVESPAFFSYTALTLQTQRIYNFYDSVAEKTYRYKENVPLFSNLTGGTRGAGLQKELFLSKEISVAAADDRVESLVASGTALLQLTSDQPGAATRTLDLTAANLPVFVNQGDVPILVAPPGLLGVPSRGIPLSDEIDDDDFAVIRLSATRPDDGDFSFLDNQGNAKPAAPMFQIRFKNRSTIWKYLDKDTGDLKSSEPEPLPLTHFGNAGTKQKASSDRVKVTKSGTRIVQLASEVLI